MNFPPTPHVFPYENKTVSHTHIPHVVYTKHDPYDSLHSTVWVSVPPMPIHFMYYETVYPATHSIFLNFV